MPRWIWEHPDWPRLRWDEARLAAPLAAARLSQGRILGAASLLDPALSREATAEALAEEGMQTSSIEGEEIDPDALRSSVARHLGLPSAGIGNPLPRG